ncbi:flippase-like domain-containing protein [bacterium]|nr:flippase-like domain-containing protein [bacterium]
MTHPEVEMDETELDAQPLVKPSITIWNFIWPVGLGLGVLGIIGYFTYSKGAFTKFISEVDPLIMSGAFAMLVIRVVMGGWRISFISRHALGFRAGIRSQLAWDFASNISPSFVGGAPLTAYYIARESRVPPNTPIAIGDVSAVMTYVMLLDQVWFALSVPVLLVAAFYMDVIPPSVGLFGLWTIMIYFLALMGYTGLFAYATLYRPETLSKVAGKVFKLPFLRKYRNKVIAEMKGFELRAAVLRRQKSDFFLRGFLLTTGTWLARFGLVVFIIWSFVPNVDLLLLSMRSIAMAMSSLIMPTPGGAGGLEGLYALFFGDLLPDTSLLAPSLLTWRVLGYYIFLVFGISLSTRHIQKTISKH